MRAGRSSRSHARDEAKTHGHEGVDVLLSPTAHELRRLRMKFAQALHVFCLYIPPIASFSIVQHERQHAVPSSLSSTFLLCATPTNGDTDFDFNRLRSIDSRLATLERSAPSTLEGFYEPHLKSFSVVPGSVDRVSVTSTCFALQTTLAAQDSGLFDSLVAMDMSSMEQKDDARIPIRNILCELLFAEWRQDDLFQVPLLLYTALKVDSERKLLGPSGINEELASRVRYIH